MARPASPPAPVVLLALCLVATSVGAAAGSAARPRCAPAARLNTPCWPQAGTRGSTEGPDTPPASNAGSRWAEVAAKACSLAQGDWCSAFYSLPWQPFRPVVRNSRSCPGDCNGVGNCHHDTGQCHCPAGERAPPCPGPLHRTGLLEAAGTAGRRPARPAGLRPDAARAAPAPPAGWTGEDCRTPQKRPCTNRLSINEDDVPPSSHIDANGRDLNWTAPGWTPGRCAGACRCASAVGGPPLPVVHTAHLRWHGWLAWGAQLSSACARLQASAMTSTAPVSTVPRHAVCCPVCCPVCCRLCCCRCRGWSGARQPLWLPELQQQVKQ
jgi:hypothetical protein